MEELIGFRQRPNGPLVINSPGIKFCKKYTGRPGKLILVDGHHRAIAAKKLGIKTLDAYVIEVNESIELGMERTAKAMNLKSLDDIQVLDYARHPLVAITHRLVRRA